MAGIANGKSCKCLHVGLISIDDVVYDLEGIILRTVAIGKIYQHHTTKGTGISPGTYFVIFELVGSGDIGKVDRLSRICDLVATNDHIHRFLD